MRRVISTTTEERAEKKGQIRIELLSYYPLFLFCMICCAFYLKRICACLLVDLHLFSRYDSFFLIFRMLLFIFLTVLCLSLLAHSSQIDLYI